MNKLSNIPPIFPESVEAKEDTARILPVPYTLILNEHINVANLMQSEQIIAQMRLSNSEMYFFALLHEAFPEYVADKDIHLSSGSIRKHVLPSLRKKMLLFVPQLYFLRLKEIGYMLKLDTLSFPSVADLHSRTELIVTNSYDEM